MEEDKMDEKVIDFGTFVLGAFIGALTYYTPQIQALAGDDPAVQLLIGLIMMTISQVGSRYAIGTIEQPIQYEPVE